MVRIYEVQDLDEQQHPQQQVGDNKWLLQEEQARQQHALLGQLLHGSQTLALLAQLVVLLVLVGAVLGLITFCYRMHQRGGLGSTTEECLLHPPVPTDVASARRPAQTNRRQKS